MKVSYFKIRFLLISLLGLLIAYSGYYFLPTRFFNDTNLLINDPWNEIGFKGSYPLTILFYNITGLKHLSFPLVGALQFIVLILLVRKIGISKRFHVLSVKNVLVYFFILVTAIYLAMPTKEFITFCFTGLLVLFFKCRKLSYRKTIVVSIITLLLFAYFFREYYFLVVLTALFLFFINKIKFKSQRMGNLVFGLLFVIFLSLSHGVIKGVFISQNTRESHNEWRAKIGDTDSNSAIISPIKTDTWYGESFGILYGFFTVNLPLNSIFRHILSPQIVVFGIWQLILFVIIYKRYGNCLNNGKKENYELWLFYFLISYFIVQGVFEPDLGSAIRHKAGIFPLIYYLMYYEEFRKEIS
ncbi:hypothetical protein ABI125_01375 [Tamlana crocina]